VTARSDAPSAIDGRPVNCQSSIQLRFSAHGLESHPDLSHLPQVDTAVGQAGTSWPLADFGDENGTKENEGIFRFPWQLRGQVTLLP